MICDSCKENAPRWASAGGWVGGAIGGQILPGDTSDTGEAPPDIEELIKQAGIPRRRILKRVIPVVQTQTVEDTQLTLVSLELYDDAFVSHVRFRSLRDRPPDNPFLHRGIPQVVLEATDDVGDSYTVWPGGGGGGENEYRFEITFTPAVTENAKFLNITAHEVTWMAMGPGQRSRVQPGPWEFRVPLA